MKRLMLATTATLALTGAAAAQSNAEATVADILAERGYGADAVERLSDGEITELYLAATSGSDSDIGTVIAGFDLPGDTADQTLTDYPGPEDIELIVSQTLDERGFAPEMIDMLSVSEMTEIYLAASAKDEAALTNTLAGLENRDALSMDAMGESDAERRVTAYLTDQGYSAERIATVGGADLAAIYLALTSGDGSMIDRTVESALES
jgi:hypothetical protein